MSEGRWNHLYPASLQFVGERIQLKGMIELGKPLGMIIVIKSHIFLI
jgi:hypothetical protein